jgi:predicted alpha/beta superfamily hydrolase
MKNHLLGGIYSVIIFLMFQNTYGQSTISIGQEYAIASEILNQECKLHIYLPDGYDQSDRQYPVIYILDGQLHFTNGVAIQKSLDVPNDLPEMIVVGIQNSYPSRVDLAWDNREKYLAFFDKELIPFIDQTFRSSNDRMLFGWEAGAAFAGFAFLHTTQLFNAAILSNGGYATENMIEEFNSLKLPTKKYLYMANSDKDIFSISYSNALAKLLTDNSPTNLVWNYQKFEHENHATLPYLTLYHGLKYYYHDFKKPTFSSIKAYQEFGGISGLEIFYKKRGERYGFPTVVANASKNDLIWLAWNRDDFDSFQFFMTEFKDVLSTERYASAYWQNRFAQFYMKHGDMQKAIAYFNAGISTYPESSRLAIMHSGLGKAYQQTNDLKLAIRHVKLAIRTAEKLSDPDLESYQSQLEELQK